MKIPVILVTGTPGTGKTTLCERLANLLQSNLDRVYAPSMLSEWSLSISFHVLDVARIIKEKKLYSEWDDKNDCSIFHGQKVNSYIKKMIKSQKTIASNSSTLSCILVEFHSCHFFKYDLFDLAIVLRSETSVLYDRLKARGYSDSKIRVNMDCETFQTVLDEVEENLDCEVTGYNNNDEKDMNIMILQILAWLYGHYRKYSPEYFVDRNEFFQEL